VTVLLRRIRTAFHRMGEIAGQFRGRKRSDLLSDRCRVLPLPLLTEEPEETVFAVDDLGDG